MIIELKNQVINGKQISKEEASILLHANLETLCKSANEIRAFFCKDAFDICTITNGKSGGCPENCKFCAQSAHYKEAQAKVYPLLNKEQIVKEAKYNADKGILRYSIVTSGRRLSKKEIDEICKSYKEIKNTCDISLCASHGLLDYEDFIKLKEAGVVRYHNNLETSRRYFPSVCTTHTYDEKIATIQAAQKAGMDVCSGGIIGMGETMEDRLDMAFELRNLGVKSVPINILNPIEGTPFGKNAVLTDEEILRVTAIFRFILPDSALRLAGGRGLLTDKGKALFQSGSNAAISGDMLTTMGVTITEDMEMLAELNYRVERL